MNLRSLLCRSVPLVVFCVVSAGGAQAQTAFKSGDLVVYRVGAGTTALASVATAVYLDEYTPTGKLVQSIALPTTVTGSTNILTASGTATSEGELNLSANGQYLALTGYDAALGTTGVASTTTGSTTNPASDTPRTVGIVNGNGVVNTSTTLDSAGISGNNIRAAYSADGTNIYVADAVNGIDYTTLGSSGTASPTNLESTVTNTRDIVIANGQVYGDTASGSTYRIFSVGTGAPTTSGQTIAGIPGSIPLTGTFSPYAFSFVTLTTGSTTPDTLYIADNGNASIDKYSLLAGSWTATGTITGLTGITGLTDSVINGIVSLYATVPAGFYGALDTSGFDGTLSGTPTLLASTSTNEAFRGIAFAPQAAGGTAATPEPTVLALTVEAALLSLGFARFRKRRDR